MAAADDHPRVTALARDLERTDRRVQGLDDRVRTVHDQLVGLATDVTRLADGIAAGTDGQPPAVRSWLQPADPVLAREDLAALCDWVTGVYLRYPGTALPSCWLWHPAAVEELLWLRGAHAAAYAGPEAAWARVADWHDRHRPGVARRLHDALGSCDLTLHQPGHGQHQPHTPAPLAYAAEEIATAWLLDGIEPDPTPRDLADADQFQTDQRHRRRRS